MNSNLLSTNNSTHVNLENDNGMPIQDHLGKDRTPNGLHAKQGLDAAGIAQVKSLAEEVRRIDRVALKLNWETRNPHIPHLVSDFCFYSGGRLVGYAPLDGTGDELELTAAVLPPHRQQGIFALLLEAARREARRREAHRLLLVSYRASQSGAAVVQALGLRYIFSEYRLEAEATALPLWDTGQDAEAVRLVQADASNVGELARVRALSFSGDNTKSPEALRDELAVPGTRYFLAECGGKYIGQIGVVDVGNGIYIRGFGIVPERRQCGYGRQLLAATMQLMLAERQKHFVLDVATDNVQALTLYETCGFRATQAYDYHDVPLKRL